MVFSEKGLDGVHWLVGEEMVLVGAICIGGQRYCWERLVFVEGIGVGWRATWHWWEGDGIFQLLLASYNLHLQFYMLRFYMLRFY